MQLVATDLPGEVQNMEVTESPSAALQNLITQDTLGVFSTRGFTPFMWDYADFGNSPCGTLYPASPSNSGLLEDN